MSRASPWEVVRHRMAALADEPAKISRVALLLHALDKAMTPRPRAEWDEAAGAVLWWRFRVNEPPYVGSPLDDDFPDYVTHWTPILVPESP